MIKYFPATTKALPADTHFDVNDMNCALLYKEISAEAALGIQNG